MPMGTLPVVKSKVNKNHFVNKKIKRIKNSPVNELVITFDDDSVVKLYVDVENSVQHLVSDLE